MYFCIIVYFPQSSPIFCIYQYLLFIMGKLFHLIKYYNTAFIHTSFLSFSIFHVTYRRYIQLSIVMHMFLFLKCIFPLKNLHFVSHLLADNVTADLKSPALAKHYFFANNFKNNFFRGL